MKRASLCDGRCLICWAMVSLAPTDRYVSLLSSSEMAHMRQCVYRVCRSNSSSLIMILNSHGTGRGRWLRTYSTSTHSEKYVIFFLPFSCLSVLIVTVSSLSDNEALTSCIETIFFPHLDVRKWE